MLRSTVVNCIACETALHTLKGPVRVNGCGHVGLCGECQDEWKGTCPECRDPVKCDQVVVFKVDGEPCTVQPDGEADEEGTGGSAKDAKPQTGAVGEDDPSGKFSKGKQPVPNAPVYEAMSARNSQQRYVHQDEPNDQAKAPAPAPAPARTKRFASEAEKDKPTDSPKKPKPDVVDLTHTSSDDE